MKIEIYIGNKLEIHECTDYSISGNYLIVAKLKFIHNDVYEKIYKVYGLDKIKSFAVEVDEKDDEI